MVDKRTDELRRLSVRLMSAQDQERRRIARDLHDGLGQELAVAKMILDKMLCKTHRQPQEACAQASDIIDRAIQQVRTMSHLLHPPLLDEVGLLSALAWYTEGLTKRSGIETFSTSSPADFPDWRRSRDGGLPYCARGADQCVPAFGSAEGVDYLASKGWVDRRFGARRRQGNRPAGCGAASREEWELALAA
jgi:hypothetical protein